MLSGRAAAWTPADCGTTHGADPGDPHLCEHVDMPVAEPGALQPQFAVPS